MTAVLAVLAIAVLLTFVVWFVGAPLRRPAPADDTVSDEQRALEAAKQAKYAEIRDTELDYRTGKLSDEDFHAIDRQLRAEAVEILRQLDALR
ncbi:MAG: hypothetical protein ABSG64_05595 [Solirubrobacteraceae bacterium]|jgi:uncharacterized membrane protein YccC